MMAAGRAFAALGFAAALAGCGLIEPAEGDMQAAVRHYIAARYGGWAQVEYLEKTLCQRSLRPYGYTCRFRLSTNTRLPLVNEGFFYYDHGWQVRDLRTDPGAPL